MGILRSDVISHSQLPDGNQSVEFDGTGDYLQVPASEAWDIGRANRPHKAVTIEWWIYLNSLSSHATFGINALSGIIAYGSNGRYAVYGGGQTLINESNSVLDAVGLNEWHHYALVLHPGPAGSIKNVEFYRDGKLSVSSTYAANVGLGVDSSVLAIGADVVNNSGYLNGFISNFRWSQEVVYKSEFTVPKFKLKALPSTMLLCCQSSTSVTEAAVSVSGSVTSNGDPAVSAFGPGLKDDITDTGVVFDGVTTFDSQAYMIPPSGKTTERNRGRGLIVANYIQPSNYNTSEFITIQSMGNSIDFGDTSAAVRGHATFASSTRAVSGSGYVAPSNVNTIEFFTIATQSNSTDFGDVTGGNGDYTPISNQTRGIFAGGYSYPAAFNAISFVTIATTGNSQDFGDMTTNRANGNRSAINSSTRGLIGGGYISPTGTNNIEFLTIATTGNSSDFGDLTAGRGNFTGLCSSTRGVFAGGSNPANNIIDFVTIASAGNASDFGDMVTGNSVACCSTSNNTRGVIVGGDLQPSNAFTNTMQHITIATTGNSLDFGDMLTVGAYRNATSDSHGGLS